MFLIKKGKENKGFRNSPMTQKKVYIKRYERAYYCKGQKLNFQLKGSKRKQDSRINSYSINKSIIVALHIKYNKNIF